MAALSPLEVDELTVVVPDLDDGDSVVVRSAQVVHLGQDRHEPEGTPSPVDVAGLVGHMVKVSSGRPRVPFLLSNLSSIIERSLSVERNLISARRTMLHVYRHWYGTEAVAPILPYRTCSGHSLLTNLLITM